MLYEKKMALLGKTFPPATHRVTWLVDGVRGEFHGTKEQVREIRNFMLHTSPLKRESVSEVLKIED